MSFWKVRGHLGSSLQTCSASVSLLVGGADLNSLAAFSNMAGMLVLCTSLVAPAVLYIQMLRNILIVKRYHSAIRRCGLCVSICESFSSRCQSSLLKLQVGLLFIQQIG